MKLNIKQADIADLECSIVEIDRITDLIRGLCGLNRGHLLLRLSCLFVLHLHIHPHSGNGRRLEHILSCGEYKADILIQNGARVKVHLVNHIGLSIVREGSLAGDKIILCEYTVHIGHDLLDEETVVVFFFVYNLAVHNTSFGKTLTDHHRINVFKAVVLFGCEKLLGLDELCNSTLNLWPGKLRFFRAAGANDEKSFVFIAAILAGKPCCGILVPCMSFHIADNGSLAVHVSIPCTKGIVNIILRERTKQLVKLRIGLVDNFLVNPAAELRHIGVQTNQLCITGIKNSTADCGIALDHGVFVVRVAAGVPVGHILGNCVLDNGFIPFKLLTNGRLRRFRFRFRNGSICS